MATTTTATLARSRIDRMRLKLIEMPLGRARGGSGATRLQMLHLTIGADDGATGTGFTYALGDGIEAVGALLEKLHLPLLDGLPVENWDRAWYELRDRTHRLGSGIALLATSAVDIAIWDLRARQAGVPLFRLLGAQRDDVAVYGSGRATHAMSTEELVEGALSYAAEGYRAVKVRVGVHPPTADLARVAAVRDALGDDVAVMVDANERMSLADALWIAPRLAELGVYWLEEPLPSRDVEAHRALARNSALPIAVGEHLQGLADFVPYAAGDTAAILQPDAPLTGGVSEFRRIDALAEAHGLTITPHFLPELHVHPTTSARTATWLEHFPLLDDLLGEVLRPVGGRVAPPDRPGHGMVWDEDAMKRYTVHSIDDLASRAY